MAESSKSVFIVFSSPERKLIAQRLFALLKKDRYPARIIDASVEDNSSDVWIDQEANALIVIMDDSTAALEGMLRKAQEEKIPLIFVSSDDSDQAETINKLPQDLRPQTNQVISFSLDYSQKKTSSISKIERQLKIKPRSLFSVKKLLAIIFSFLLITFLVIESALILINHSQNSEIKSVPDLITLAQSDSDREIEGDLEYLIGPGFDHETINEALAALPKKAKSLRLHISGDQTTDTDIEIPNDKNIDQVEIINDNLTEDVTIDLNGHDLFANGISLSIGEGVIVRNGRVFGAAKVTRDGEETITIDQTELDIKGSVETIYGGGLSTIPGKGLSIDSTSILLNGEVTEDMYGGSLVQHGGSSQIKSWAWIITRKGSNVNGDVSGGNKIEDNESSAEIGDSSLMVSGNIGGTLSGGSVVSGGGRSVQKGKITLLVNPEAGIHDLVGGSRADGSGSYAENGIISSTIFCNAERITGGSIASNGASTIIQFTQTDTPLQERKTLIDSLNGINTALGLTKPLSGTVEEKAYLIDSILDVSSEVSDVVIGGSRGDGANSKVVNTGAIRLTIKGKVKQSVIGSNIVEDGARSSTLGESELIIGPNAVMTEGLLGGSCANGTGSEAVDVMTSIVIKGSVEGGVFGGSLINDGGHSQISQRSTLNIAAGGNVKGPVVAGSTAFGTDSEATDVITTVIIEGSVEGEVCGGSMSGDGAHTQINQGSTLTLASGGNVKGSVVGGSGASGTGSEAVDVIATAIIEGSVEGSAYGGSIAEDSGRVQISQSSTLTIAAGGNVKGSVYGGSKASGTGSEAHDITTSTIVEGTVEEWAIGGSNSQDGGYSQISQSSNLTITGGGNVKGAVLGGSRASGTGSEALDVITTAIIEGSVEGWAYGGSNSQNGGYSQISQGSNLTIAASGKVKGLVFGGSRTSDPGSEAVDVITNVSIKGLVESWAIGGSNSQNGGHSQISQGSNLTIAAGGNVKGSVVGGSRAYGTGSEALDVITTATIDGLVEGYAFGGGYAKNGGHTQISQNSAIKITASGKNKESVYGGSFANGTGSETKDTVTTTLIEGSVEGWAIGGSHSQNGGHSQISQGSNLTIAAGGNVKGAVVGGSRAYGTGSEALDVKTTATIEGLVEGWAYGGCCSEDGGHSQISQSSTLTIAAGGNVKRSVFGGSRSSGTGSEALDVITTAIIEGSVEDWAYGGSYSQDGGHSQISQSSNLTIAAGGNVKGSVLGGSRTSGTGSGAVDVITTAIIDGSVKGWAFGGSYADKGGHTQISQSSSITVETGGLIEGIVFSGSFSLGAGSYTEGPSGNVINNGQVNGDVTIGSYHSDGET